MSAVLAEWQSLGTSAVLALADDRALREARAIVERELDQIDRACSRFRADSDLSRVNAHAGRYVHVSDLLIHALDVALRAARLTDGDLDPTVGRALELAGYDRDWRLLDPAPAEARMDDAPLAGHPSPKGHPSSPDRLPSVGPPLSVGPLPSVGPPPHVGPLPRVGHAQRVQAIVRRGWQSIEIDRARCAVRVPRGVKLDLGSTAKAWAADRACLAVHEATGVGALVSLGGDISARGPTPPGGWTVHVTDDHRAGASAPGQTISIHGGGLATSSVTARRWSDRGRAMHHIIDPRTAAPARGPWRTVSVAAIDCVDANIASTTALIRGSRAAQWLSSLRLPARLVSHEGAVLTVGAWPPEREPHGGRPAAAERRVAA